MMDYAFRPLGVGKVKYYRRTGRRSVAHSSHVIMTKWRHLWHTCMGGRLPHPLSVVLVIPAEVIKYL